MPIDFSRIQRVRDEMRSRDWDGVSTLLSGDIHAMISLIVEQQRLIDTALEAGIDQAWRDKAEIFLKAMGLGLESLITELQKFARHPTKEQSAICRLKISSLERFTADDPELKAFLESAFSMVVRPYRGAPTDIRELVSAFLEARRKAR